MALKIVITALNLIFLYGAFCGLLNKYADEVEKISTFILFADLIINTMYIWN